MHELARQPYPLLVDTFVQLMHGRGNMMQRALKEISDRDQLIAAIRNLEDPDGRYVWKRPAGKTLSTHVPRYPDPGSDIPGMPGFVVGKCTHRMARSEWRAGYRNCERCGG